MWLFYPCAIISSMRLQVILCRIPVMSISRCEFGSVQLSKGIVPTIAGAIGCPTEPSQSAGRQSSLHDAQA